MKCQEWLWQYLRLRLALDPIILYLLQTLYHDLGLARRFVLGFQSELSLDGSCVVLVANYTR